MPGQTPLPALPSLHALRAFEAAARRASFARASAELHLTPSAISHQVRALEAHLGCALFVRTGRQVVPTPDGARLAAVLAEAFGAIRAACAGLGAPARPHELAVHCSPSFAATWLAPRLPAFLAAHPGLDIRLTSSAEPVDLSAEAGLDVVIAYGRPAAGAGGGAGLTTHSLGPEEIAVLCAPALAARLAPDGQAPGLAEATRLESSFSPVSWSEWFSANGLPTPPARRGPAFDRGSLVIAAAVQGLGLALESVRFAEAELAAGHLARLGGERYRGLRRDLHFLTYRTRDAQAEKIRCFWDWIRAEAA